jgi:hypothetical protein
MDALFTAVRNEFGKRTRYGEDLGRQGACSNSVSVSSEAGWPIDMAIGADVEADGVG